MKRAAIIAMTFAVILPLAASGAMAKPATSPYVSRDSLAAVIRSMGMTVEDKTTRGETPWLLVNTTEGDTFNVFLYVCKDDANPRSPCEQAQFRMLWDNTKGRTTDDVNRFHLEKVFGRGYLTEDKKMIGVEYPMHLTGGVTMANVRENVDYFLRVTRDFVDIVKP
jgi:hypothetical protein